MRRNHIKYNGRVARDGEGFNDVAAYICIKYHNRVTNSIVISY